MLIEYEHHFFGHADPASRWDDNSDDDNLSKEGPAAKLSKSRWLDDEADDAHNGDRAASEVNPQEDAAPDSGENLVVPSEDPAGPVSDSSPMAQEIAAPVHPRKRNMLLESRGKDNFEFLREIGSGTYGLVSKCGPFVLLLCYFCAALLVLRYSQLTRVSFCVPTVRCQES